MELMTKITGLGGAAAKVVLCVMVCAPPQAFSCDGDNVKANRFYVSGSYRSSFPSFSNLDVAESKTYVPDVMTVTKMSMRGDATADINDRLAFAPYRPAYYENDYFGFSGSAGVLVGSWRIELEGTRNTFPVRGGEGSVREDNASYTALVRGEEITASNYIVVRNKKIGIETVALNVCYDIKANTDPVISYMCFGVSGNSLNLLETKKLVHGYQGKIGVGVHVTPNVVMFLGGYYHTLHGSNYEGMKVIVPEHAALYPKATSAQAKMSIAYLGGEVGLRYAF
ncbi:P44/Msp2 family outer membrane protein, omp subset [Anaplasma platys]|uniref:P44/Msp2 family outer membrane protein, omp subset n=1 Tax=Anaplasma platys TaxID=949 RepID=A0A858PZB3_9RICK|nr:P44/Msp2 family outer membrane protein [Anaplasma platys]QJC27956.1 P44/Msp2 family outer membrane protein, omp subset [Anaplasma platys]